MPGAVYIPRITAMEHFYFFMKSVIVGSSWVFAYYGLKHLPITIVSPIRSTSPVWTILGALVIFSEKLSWLQWAGVTLTLVFFYMFSLAGKKEGIVFRKNKWVFFIVLATLIGAGSSLYDKYLLLGHHRLAMQTWFLIYLVPLLWIVWKIQQKHQAEKTSMRFTWAIPLIGISLALADYAYFLALASDDALISILAAIRRSSVVYSFFLGALIFKDRNVKQKWPLLLGILAGVYLIIQGS
jgi:transporter family protein